MPRKRKEEVTIEPGKGLNLDPELIKQLVPGTLDRATINEQLAALKKAIFERALGGELAHHLGYEKGEAKPAGSTNHRNGTSRKRIATDDDLLDVEIPRDREGTFDPVLIAKGERRFTGETPSGSQVDLLGDEPAGMTAQEAVWSLGVPMLVAAGQADRSARSLLGKWCKAYGAPAVQAAIVRCSQAQAVEPVSWLIAALGAPKAADGGQGPRSGGSASGGDWWAKAGFAKEYEATNAGCSERYAHLWRNGEKIPDAERRAMAGVPR